MRLNLLTTAIKTLKKLSLLTVFASLFAGIPANAQTNVFTVTSTADSDPFNLVQGTLRWAIKQANASTQPASIEFNISGTVPQTLTLNGSYGSLPTLNNTTGQPISIDGSTQPANGYTGNEPKIIVNGNNLSGSSNLLTLGGSGGYTINGISFQNIPQFGIYVVSSGNRISNNSFYGKNPAQLPLGGGASYITISQGDNITVINNRIGTNFQNTINQNPSPLPDGMLLYNLPNVSTVTISNILIQDNIIKNVYWGLEIHPSVTTEGQPIVTDEIEIIHNLIYNIGVSSSNSSLHKGGIFESPLLYPRPSNIQYVNGLISGTTSSPYDKIEIYGGNNYADAEQYITTVTADGNGNWAVAIGDQPWKYITVTATASSSQSGGYPNTSEFNTVLNCPPLVVARNNGLVCLGSLISLTATPLLNGATYSWSGPGNFSSSLQHPVLTNVTSAQGGTYTVTVSRSQCPVLTATTTVVIQPQVTVTPSQTICYQSNTATLTASGASSYSWTPSTFLSATTGASVISTPTVTTAYTVTAASSSNNQGAVELIYNGGFELGNAGFSSQHDYFILPNTVNITTTTYDALYSIYNSDASCSTNLGWLGQNADCIDHTTGNGHYITATYYGGIPDNIALWQQGNIPVSPNTNYNFSFVANSILKLNSPPGPLKFQVIINNSPVGSPITISSSGEHTNLWTPYSIVWNSGANTTIADIKIVTSGFGQQAAYAYLDDVSFRSANINCQSAATTTVTVKDCTEPCQKVTKSQNPDVQLVLPVNFGTADVNTQLSYSISHVPALLTGTSTYTLLLQVAPEQIDPVTGLHSGDWTKASGFNRTSAGLSTGTYTEPLNLYMNNPGNAIMQTGYQQPIYWRVGIQYGNSVVGGVQYIDWSPAYKMILQPYAPVMPSSAQLLSSAHTNNINWVYGSSFLDNGLTSEGIAYIDGLGKSRQVQSRQNSTNTIMAVEAAYSEEGGGTVMSLPAPLGSSQFGYANRFFDVHDGSGWKDFATEDFDREIKGASENALMAPTPLDQTLAGTVGNYYSINNNTDTYVDAANGYPYVYNVGEKSPLQRPMLSAAGTGSDFKITSGKENKHFYLHPMQEELDRVYGVDNAPAADKIAEKIVIDPDGVGHVSYTDNEGKLIATALITCNTPSLKPLQEDGMTGFLTYLNPLTTDQMMSPSLYRFAQSKFFIGCQQTPVNIVYNLNLTSFQVNDAAPCAECKYNVYVSIINNQTNKEVYTKTQAIIPSQNTCPDNPQQVSIINETVNLTGPASFTINRVIMPYVDPVTGQDVVTSELNNYLASIDQNRSQLFNDFHMNYNSQSYYFLLRKIKTPQTVISFSPAPCQTTVSTYAGTSQVPQDCDRYSIGLGSPSGITRDNNGNFYITEASNHLVREIGAKGNVSVIGGVKGQSGLVNGVASKFNSPADVVYRAFRGIGSDQFPSSLIVADDGNNAIRMIDIATGTATLLVGSSQGISHPKGVGIDGNGVAYIANTQGANIFSLNLSGGTAVLTQLFTSYTFSQPTDIAPGTNGEFYVTDAGNNTLIRFTPGSSGYTATTLLSLAGNSNFSQPRSVVYVNPQLVYVSCAGSNKLFAVNPLTSSVKIIAGSISGLADGDGTIALLNTPMGLYSDGNSELYIADAGNNRIRKADISSCTSSSVTTTYDWYSDRATLNTTAGAAYATDLGQLDGDQNNDGFPGDEHYGLTGIALTGPANAGMTANFIAGFKRAYNVDLTGKVSGIDVYSINAGSQLGTQVATIDKKDHMYASDIQNCYLLHVTYSRSSCEESCIVPNPPVDCTDQCTQQQMALQMDMDAAYDDLYNKGTGAYTTNGIVQNLQQFVHDNYPLSVSTFVLLNATDGDLYDAYSQKRDGFEQFSMQDCMNLCQGQDPGPCKKCGPEYESCAYDNMNTLNDAYDYLIGKWDAAGGDTPPFPYAYTDLIHTDNATGKTYPDATEAENLSLPFLNFLAGNINNSLITTRANWDLKAGGSSSCATPATAGCPGGNSRDMSLFPTLMFGLLESMNQQCGEDYNACLQMNGTPAQQRAYMCVYRRDSAISFMGPVPQPANNTNQDWVDYQTKLSQIQSDYTACANGTANPDPLQQARKTRIQQTLAQLYPNPSDSTTIDNLTVTLLAQTASMDDSDLEEFLTEYQDEQSCVLQCKKQELDAFEQYITELKQTAKQTVTDKFVNSCYGNMQENMQLSYRTSSYHYTLYNYDKANNLVSTIPPEGIDYIDINDPAQYTASVNGSARHSRVPQHRMISTYVSSSLYTLKAASPDEGETWYLYDKAGRLRFSQTAEQRARERQLGYKIYSYVTYDNESRVIESGEFRDDHSLIGHAGEHYLAKWDASDNYAYPYTPMLTLTMKDIVDLTFTPEFFAPLTFEETYVTYDDATLPAGFTRNGIARSQTYMQGRVASTYNRDATTGNISSKTHYSYDAHGRVSFIVQEIPALSAAPSGGYVTVDYTYKNLTSRVDQIVYQKGNVQEEFRQRYTYDSDYRITIAEVSRDGGANWLPAANYDYYLHGPLKSTTLGNNIQNMDYVYNINGWLKAINNPLAATFANDANESTTGTIAPDVFSEAINYYNGDYKRTGVGLDNTSLTVPQAGSYLKNNSDVIAKDLFSGNINSTITNTAFNLTGSPTAPDNILAQGYAYDVLNRLTDVYAETKPDNFTAFAATGGATGDYATHITYDANGNIQTLIRNSLMRAVTGVGTTNQMDNMTYRYAQTTTDYYNHSKKTNNRLAHVNDAAISEATLDDIKDQDQSGTPYDANNATTQNYQYDAKGRIIQDLKSGIQSIQWTVSDKVKKITKTDGTQIDFTYNAQQQRQSKKVTPATGTNSDVTTYYTYDANGILMSTYEYSYNSTANAYQYKINDQQMYGMGRLGVYNLNEILVSSPGAVTNDASKQFFEISDHLGSVRAVVSGLKKSNGNADILQLTDYHEFGMTMLNRTFGAGTYRFQYQGSEQDREITNGNNSNYTTEFRSLDVRLGRWLSPDPITHPSWSPYHSMYDNPIGVTDVMGLDGTRSPDSKPTQYDDNGNGVSEPNEGCDGTNESAGKSTETLFKGDNIGGIKYVQGDVSHYVQVEYNGKKYSFSDTPQPNSEGIGAGKYGKAPENTLDNLETWLEIAEKEKDGIPAFDDVFYSDDECWELVVDDVVMEYALILAGNQAGNAIQKGATTGSIYLVPGTSTKSGKPYVGRNNTPDPAKNRKSKDGRDRTKAKVIDNYDANDEELGSYLEQTHINKNGVPKKTLDNKRNEVSPARMKDLQKKYRGKVLPPSKNQQKQIKEKKKEDSDYLINHG